MLPLILFTSFISLAGASAIPRATSTLLQSLFPMSTGLESWTTCVDSPTPHPLSDATFHPEKEIEALGHPFVPSPPDGSSSSGRLSMKIHYPKGSYRFGFEPQGGVSFYAKGPDEVDISRAKELTFGYSVWFPAGFEFVKGGKLPGLFGGDNSTEAFGCSGGRRSDTCFSARLMWRADGAGEFYTYFPTDYTANEVLCDVPPYSKCDALKGTSVGRGAFTFATGGWTTISQRVRLNDIGKENGEIQMFVGGVSVIDVGGLVLRARSASKVRGIQMQSFFGGADDTWASPKDQDVYFTDFSVAILEML